MDTFTLQLNGGDPVALTLNAIGEFVQDVTLIDGSNTLVLQATDFNGNESPSTTVVIELLTDKTPPTIQPTLNLTEPGKTAVVASRIKDTFAGTDTLDYSTPKATIRDSAWVDVAVLSLFDDGSNGDAFPDDAIFTNIWPTLAGQESFYSVDFSASDYSGNLAVLNGVSLPVFDDPIIGAIEFNPTEPTITDPVTLTVEVTDTSGITAVVVGYAPTGETNWTDSNAIPIGDDRWEAVPGILNAGQCDVRVKAYDSHSRKSTESTTLGIVRQVARMSRKYQHRNAKPWSSCSIPPTDPTGPITPGGWRLERHAVGLE